jgi:CRP-like cAMP-binding protein
MSEALKAILRHKEFPRGKCWDEEDYLPDQTILREGESSADLYLILNGVVRVNMAVDVAPGQHLESGLMEMTHGDTFGELNLYSVSDRAASVVTMSQTKVIRIDGVRLTAFMDRYPELGYPVLKDFFVKHADMLRMAKERLSSLYADKLRHDD